MKVGGSLAGGLIGKWGVKCDKKIPDRFESHKKLAKEKRCCKS